MWQPTARDTHGIPSHLPEMMQITAAHRQHFSAVLEVDVGGFVGATGAVADGA